MRGVTTSHDPRYCYWCHVPDASRCLGHGAGADPDCVSCARFVENDRSGKWGMRGRHAFETASRMSYCQAVYR